MSKQFWAIIAAIAIVFIGIVVLSSDKKSDDSSGNKDALTQHVKGQGTSGVTLVEYGDYQCPHCQAYHATVKAVQAKYNDQIKFQFRNFPIQSAHPNAFAAARAAEAADQQGKFWEMHDMLYSPQNFSVWTKAEDPNPDFQRYAQQLGLNVEKFKTDFASSKVNSLINADLKEGTDRGVTGTPAFFLDGKKVEIANSPAAFEKVIDEAIKKKSSSSN